MTLHVKMNCKANVESWSREEIFVAFQMLNPPEATFKTWLERISPKQASDGTKPVAIDQYPASSEMTTDDKVEHNTRALGLIPAICPMARVTRHPPEKVA